MNNYPIIIINKMIKKLKEIETAYKCCFNIDGYENFKYPSLKYTIYHGKMFNLFNKKIKNIEADIDIAKKQ